MVNVNIDFPEDLHRKAKAKASLEGVHLKDFIIVSVRDKIGDL